MRKSPDWRCNTIRTTRHPLEWTSPILIHGFESFQNQACETLSFSETKMKQKSTRKVHLPNITQSSGGFPTTRFPNNQSLQPTSPTKLIDCDSWPPRPPRIFVPLLWWPVIQMSNLLKGGISASCFWGHMGWKHREYWILKIDRIDACFGRAKLENALLCFLYNACCKQQTVRDLRYRL